MSRELAVLLVDDDRIIIDSLGLQLRRLRGDVTVESASSVSEAWEVIEELDAGGVTLLLVISDWLMPLTRGDAFLDDLKSKHPGIKRVMLTGQADHDALERVQARRLVDILLRKPWSDQDVHDVLALIPAAVSR